MGLLAAKKQLVQFIQGLIDPGWSPVVALTAPLGGFHVAQQGIHLRDAELSIGSDRTMTGHGGQ